MVILVPWFLSPNASVLLLPAPFAGGRMSLGGAGSDSGPAEKTKLFYSVLNVCFFLKCMLRAWFLLAFRIRGNSRA